MPPRLTTVDGLSRKQISRDRLQFMSLQIPSIIHIYFIHPCHHQTLLDAIMQCHTYPRRKTNDADSTPSAKVVMHRRRVSISSRADASFLNTMTRLILVPPGICPVRASPLSVIVFRKLCVLCSVLCSAFAAEKLLHKPPTVAMGGVSSWTL